MLNAKNILILFSNIFPMFQNFLFLKFSIFEILYTFPPCLAVSGSKLTEKIYQ